MRDRDGLSILGHLVVAASRTTQFPSVLSENLEEFRASHVCMIHTLAGSGNNSIDSLSVPWAAWPCDYL